jgi:hypothetical protein
MGFRNLNLRGGRRLEPVLNIHTYTHSPTLAPIFYCLFQLRSQRTHSQVEKNIGGEFVLLNPLPSPKLRQWFSRRPRRGVGLLSNVVGPRLAWLKVTAIP